MQRNGVIYDLFLIFTCIYFFTKFILKRNLIKKEKFITDHWASKTRIPFILTLIGEIIYIFLCDIEVLSGSFYFEITILFGVQFLLMLLGICLIRYRFGPKNWKFKYETQMALAGIMCIILIFTLIYFFDNYYLALKQ